MIYLTLIMIGLLCGLYYSRTVVAEMGIDIADSHLSMLNLTATNPARYRVLATYLVSLLSNAQNYPQVINVYTGLHALGFGVMFICLYHWLSCFVNRFLALAGVLIVATYMQLMLYVWANSLYNVFEVIFLCLALLVIRQAAPRWEWKYGVLIAIATLNRETAILLPILFGFIYLSRYRTRWYWFRLILFAGIWGVVYVALRLILGPAPDGITVAEIWRSNIGGEWRSQQAILKNVFFLPLWIGAIAGLRKSPQFVRSAALAALPYLFLFLVFALWNEVRLLLPVLVLALPPFLIYLQAELTPEAEAV